MSRARTWALGIPMLIGAFGCASGGAGDAPSDPVDPTCPAAPAGVSTAPATILDAIGMANALFAARPAGASSLSLPCFVERLSRPMATLGVNSVFSLQPADGVRSPRIFIWSGPLVMSVAPAGSASDRLELAEYPNPLRSLKAEMLFPITAPVAPNQPFDHLRNGTGTICGGCHPDEQPSPLISFTQAFDSVVFQPRPVDVVSLPYMQDQTRTCDPRQEPYRCAMLHAVFDAAGVTTGAFAADAPTIFE